MGSDLDYDSVIISKIIKVCQSFEADYEYQDKHFTIKRTPNGLATQIICTIYEDPILKDNVILDD